MTECPGCGLIVEDMPDHARTRHHAQPEDLALVPPMTESQSEYERVSGLVVVRDRPSDGGYL